MKIRLLSVTLICALAALPAVRAEDAKKDDQTELGGHMEKIGGAWRAIKRQVADASKNEDTLKRLAVIKDNMNAALKLQPEKTADLPEADRAKFVANYKDSLKNEMALVAKVEAAVKAGDNAGAAKLVADVDQAQKDAHKEFKKAKKKQ
jgi:hypothetical protein